MIGPNGAGKTTVFNCITGFYRPTAGADRAWRIPTAAPSCSSGCGYRIAKPRSVARTFQNIRLFAGMTVLENLLVAQHNALMAASGFTIAGLFGLPTLPRAPSARRSRRRATGWTASA